MLVSTGSSRRTCATCSGCVVDEFTSADLLAYWQANGIYPTQYYYTGEELGDGWHLDHMTPLPRGGRSQRAEPRPMLPNSQPG